MDQLPEFMQSSQAIALGVAVVIFLIMVFLASKKVIGLIFTLTLLLITIALSLFISQQNIFTTPSKEHPQKLSEESADFKAQILHMITSINTELSQEKESIKQVSEGVQSLILQVDAQKQKLQSFMDETREKFSKIKVDPSVSQDAGPHQNEISHPAEQTQ